MKKIAKTKTPVKTANTKTAKETWKEIKNETDKKEFQKIVNILIDTTQ